MILQPILASDMNGAAWIFVVIMWAGLAAIAFLGLLAFAFCWARGPLGILGLVLAGLSILAGGAALVFQVVFVGLDTPPFVWIAESVAFGMGVSSVVLWNILRWRRLTIGVQQTRHDATVAFENPLARGR
jgi:hypothetical protein